MPILVSQVLVFHPLFVCISKFGPLENANLPRTAAGYSLLILKLTIRKLDWSKTRLRVFKDTSERLARETSHFSANWYDARGIWCFSAKLSFLNLVGLSASSAFGKMFQNLSFNKQFFTPFQHEQSSNYSWKNLVKLQRQSQTPFFVTVSAVINQFI